MARRKPCTNGNDCNVERTRERANDDLSNPQLLRRPDRPDRAGDGRPLVGAGPAVRQDAGGGRGEGGVGRSGGWRKLEQVCAEIREAGGVAEALRARRHGRRALHRGGGRGRGASSARSPSSSTTPAFPERPAGAQDVARPDRPGARHQPARTLRALLRGSAAADRPEAARPDGQSSSSVGAFSYSGNGAALYSITKAAVVRMTEALAVEWAPFNINVNAIAPGAFSSEMMDGMLQRMGDITQSFPRKRLGDPAQLDGLDAAVPGLPVVRVRHRHVREGRRRAGEPVAEGASRR